MVNGKRNFAQCRAASEERLQGGNERASGRAGGCGDLGSSARANSQRGVYIRYVAAYFLRVAIGRRGTNAKAHFGTVFRGDVRECVFAENREESGNLRCVGGAERRI